MALTDTNRISDIMPFSPLSATASIYPALMAPAQDDVGTAWLADLGGPIPFGCDLGEPSREERR
jgi:hypothetical protein